MRKILILLCLVIMGLPASRLYAHPPEKVILSYDPAAHSLTAEVIHPVGNPGSHFVDRVEVFLNDKKVIEKEPIHQDATGFSEAYPLPDAKPGDTVKVAAFCNRGGDRSGQIQIAAADQS